MYWAKGDGRNRLTGSVGHICFVFINVAMKLNVVYILLTGTFYMNYMNVAF